jgi:hypothetical protein
MVWDLILADIFSFALGTCSEIRNLDMSFELQLSAEAYKTFFPFIPNDRLSSEVSSNEQRPPVTEAKH